MTSGRKRMKGLLEESLEWEALMRPVTFEHGVDFPRPPFLNGVRRVILSRGEELELRLVAEGILADAREFQERRSSEREVAIGSFIDPVEMKFSAYGSECFLRAHVDTTPDLSMSAAAPTKFTQRGMPIRFRRRFTERFKFEDEKDVPDFVPLGPEGWRSDWFINGPRTFVFTGATRRRVNASFRRERAIGATKLSEAPSGDGTSFDHFVVDAGGVRFSVSKVPEDYAPSWARPISIDYAAPVPEEDVRDAIAEIVSFVLGRRLIPMGSTLFDDVGWTIEEEVVNPWGQGIQRICGQGEMPPVPVRSASDDAEQALTLLVPAYLKLRKELQLNDALLAYWLADEAYTAVDLVVYASAVEALKNAWLAVSGTQRGKYMPESDFRKLFADQLAAFKSRVEELKLPSAMHRKIENAWSTSGNEEIRTFLTALKLELGAAEKKAMQQRNVPAHGGIKVGADFRQLTRHAHAYRVLFTRIFLTLLGYEGSYVDRTTLGHPARLVSEPSGGASAGTA